jgi:hypothetical protein
MSLILLQIYTGLLQVDLTGLQAILDFLSGLGGGIVPL